MQTIGCKKEGTVKMFDGRNTLQKGGLGGDNAMWGLETVRCVMLVYIYNNIADYVLSYHYPHLTLVCSPH